MSKNLSLQIIASVVCIFFGIAFLNPFNFIMETMTHMVILGTTTAAFGAVAVLILLERGGDEREFVHRAFAGRAGFLVGASILLFAIVWQAFRGPVDPWLVIGLCGMVATKTIARLYSQARL